MQPSLERGDCHRCVVAAGEDQHHVERLVQEIFGGGE
jgi:hypothetical protein